MSFAGSSPLNSPSEFDITHTAFCTVSVAAGQINFDAVSASGEDAIFASLLSGLAVDASYVAVNYANDGGGGPGIYNTWPGFIDNSAAQNYFALLINRDNPVTVATLKTVIAGTPVDLAMTITESFDGVTPARYALEITGTVATAYGYVSGAWIPFASVDAVGYITTVLLETLYAGVLIVGGDSRAGVIVDEHFWGPGTDLSGTTSVPDIVGDSVTVATAALVSAGLIAGTTTQVLDPSPPGTVLTQNPAAGTTVASGSAVDFTYSEGVAVPDIVNTSVAVVAPGLLAAAGFVLGAVTYAASATVITGNVISQNPAAGAFAAGGSAVDVVVSSGLPAITVPDIYGLSQSDAILAIESAGLTVGGIGSAPSDLVPPNLVQLQNPTAGTAVAVGSIVSFVLSLGVLAVGTEFDFEATVISQYANSPTIMQLVKNLNQYIDQSTNFANFFNYVWNVDTAVGFGLDIWGKIVGVSRLLNIPNSVDYIGFDNSATPPPDWQTMGSSAAPYNDPPVGGALYTGYNATTAYLLLDDAYRQLILAKAFANICTTTAPAINQILQNLYGPGTAWVLNEGPMAISYNLSFTPSAIQLAILEQSGVIPTPPAVSVVINTGV